MTGRMNTGSVFIEDDDVDQALFGSVAFTYDQNAQRPSINDFRKEKWLLAP
jgi:hypothetical protein